MPISSGDHDRYILHLNQALAMERALVDHLEKRAHAVRDPQVRERLLQHREETRQHEAVLHEVILSLRGEPTATKANVQAPITPGMVGKVMTALESEKEDRLLAEDLADFAVENYEAGLYSALMLIAGNLGYPQHASRFEAIRQQERDMADFIAAGQASAVRRAFPPVGPVGKAA